MVEKDIIKAMECCIEDVCDECPCSFGNCYTNLIKEALDLIEQQKTELERACAEIDRLKLIIKAMAEDDIHD